MVSAFKHQHHGKVQLVHLLRKKGDGLEAGLRFCRAAGKCGVVFQTVILRQVAEGKTVGKEQGAARSVVCNGLVLGIQALQLCQIVLGILRIDLCEAGIQAAKLLADNAHDGLGVAQGKPYVLVVFDFGVAAVLHQAF